MELKKMKKLPDPSKKITASGPVQVVAHNLARWVMMLGIGMGGVGMGAFYFDLLVEGTMLLSIFFVSVTLYWFLRWWPENDARPESRPVPVAPVAKPKQAMVSAVHIQGPPRTRCILALREMVRRQETFQISRQGAEAFAKTIRYMLRTQR